LAVHWSRIDDVLNQAGDLAGKVIVSCSLPLNAANTELVLGHTTSRAEALAKKVPDAEVVSAFNNIPSEVLLGVFEARGKAVYSATKHAHGTPTRWANLDRPDAAECSAGKTLSRKPVRGTSSGSRRAKSTGTVPHPPRQ
jgi:hypothetical protein